jgi:hypothetical protein
VKELNLGLRQDESYSWQIMKAMERKNFMLELGSTSGNFVTITEGSFRALLDLEKIGALKIVHMRMLLDDKGRSVGVTFTDSSDFSYLMLLGAADE